MKREGTKKFLSATLVGVDAKVIEVEGAFSKGLPSFNIVGLASSDIQESKERVRSALISSNIELPPLKITVNLSPSDIKKSGTHFDLPIALLIGYDGDIKEDIFIFGELGLDGRVKSSSTIFPIIFSLKEQGLIKRAIVPKESLDELKFIKDVEFFGVEWLKDALEVLEGKVKGIIVKNEFKYDFVKINSKKFYYLNSYPLDFRDVKSQEMGIEAALISAAGFHNILLNGSPGVGKSMIAKRLKYILPPLSEEEILEIARYSYLNKEEFDFKPIRPFRAPHHSATMASIFGGGSNGAKIGEAALANRGILFFDELPHFLKGVLEALREPLEDRVINIARVNNKVRYKADFLFVAAMNPCPCGNLLSKKKECRCTQREILRYQKRISEPILDRIELSVIMGDVDLNSSFSTTSKELHQKVIEAFIFQRKRAQEKFNARLVPLEMDRFIKLDINAQEILDKAAFNLSLSFRSINNILRVARTIADLKQEDKITKESILKAISFRNRLSLS
ncbi:MAG: YifB family Mg chelatase-like AAA ATPase [Epsilonproteobacteria bacterium]|nr:YifB family Mg chelatase-like AAA ATPase [Campylobacterota bacterium]